ncbi:recombination regulator RecX [Streptomyces sp. NPDC005423]|uniref:recombination regulator RecX n=1 Tax=Streptomyces sp. NPDC005423 TaxID=3155343 RepID=UPI00339F5320
MTRRTDWAEFDRPAVPQGRGSGGDAARGTDGAPDEPYGSDGPYGGESGGEWTADGFTGDAGPPPPGSRSRGGSAESGSPGYGSRRGRGGLGDGGFRGGGARGGRGRRGRGSTEPSDADEGFPPSARAEKKEPPADPAERARGICLRLLTGTPRTRRQLADALRKREIPDEVAEEVLSRFEEVGLINDGAFAEAWVESRHHGRGLARRALAQELRNKGVETTLIDEAVSQLDSEQEEATARDLVARKLRSTRGLDRDKRLRRLAGMLARKGYSQGLALRVVRQALEEEGEDTESLTDEEF